MWERLRPRQHALALACIVVAGFAFRIWGIAWGLQDANVSRRPHPDEWAVYWLVRWFGLQHSLNPCPSAPTQCFFDWGTVFPYGANLFHFLAAPFFGTFSVSTFGPQVDPTFAHIVLAARLFSVVMSTATIVVVYWIARIGFNRNAGLLAALLTAMSGLLIQIAHFGTPDATTGLFLSLALLAAIRASDHPSAGTYTLAGGFVGLSAGSEYHMALLLVPMSVAWLVGEQRRIHYLFVGGSMALGTFLISNPFVIPEFQSFLTALEHTFRIRTVDSRAQYQDRWARYNPPLLYVLRYPLGYGVGVLLTVWYVAGTVFALYRRGRANIIILAWIVPYAVLVTVSSAKFMRYSAPLFPALAVLGGAGAYGLFTRARGRKRVFVVAGASVALIFSGTYDAAYTGLFSTVDARITATRWIASHAPPGSGVAFEELPSGLTNLPYYIAEKGYHPCFVQFRARNLGNGASFLMLDNYALEEHPQVTGVQVRSFRLALQHDSTYQLVKQIRNEPTFLGMHFPIDASPHDWRYPSHVISIYRHVSKRTTSSYCYANLTTAIAALYTRPKAG